MNKLQKEHLTWQLAKRLELVEQCQAHLESVGGAFRQIASLDKKLSEWLQEEGIPVPDTFTAESFKAAFNREAQYQLAYGDPPRGSALAAMAAPRANLELQMKEIHNQLIAGNPTKGD